MAAIKNTKVRSKRFTPVDFVYDALAPKCVFITMENFQL